MIESPKPAQLLRSKSLMWLPDATGPIAIVSITRLMFNMSIMEKLKKHHVKNIYLLVDMENCDSKEVSAIAKIAEQFKDEWYSFCVLHIMTPSDCMMHIRETELQRFYERTHNESATAISHLLNDKDFSSICAYAKGTLSDNMLGKTYSRLSTEGDKARALTFHANAALNVLCTLGQKTPRDMLLNQFSKDHKGSLDNVVYVDASSKAQEIVPFETALVSTHDNINSHKPGCTIC